MRSVTEGIDSPGLGSIAVSSEGARSPLESLSETSSHFSRHRPGKLRLRGPSGDVITESLPLGQLSCAAVGGRPQARSAPARSSMSVC